MENKKKSTTINNVVLIVGVVLLVLGVIFLVRSIGSYKEATRLSELNHEQAMSEYNVAYEEWEEKWLNHQADLSEKPEHPGFAKNVNPPAMLFVSIFLIFGGFVATAVGTTPYFAKLQLKNRKEIMEYNGEDYSEFREDMDNMGFAEKEEETTKTCLYCGSTIDAGAKVCDNCGAKQ